eukprot:TRINITY_DN5007_c0_g1_i3.p1 TRINITY_DN5007_c0_g1~~TRINITY_DN5007_c0_g1_i3.p1  ORF type:complete len:501 (+),score=89.01 TRINITY_DN5007_c0_g1_i3:54-1556(+)
MGRKGKAPTLGRALIKDKHFSRGTLVGGEATLQNLHSTELPDSDRKVYSITECSDLQEFLDHAILADTQFIAEKENVVVIADDSRALPLQTETPQRQYDIMKSHENFMVIPRRPPWDDTMTADKVDQNEREIFLEWRRNLARTEQEEQVTITPFEKNLEIWRQLWRVVERSDVVVQIVDARNPLLFRSSDLESYVKEIDPNKINLLLINKADLLPRSFRILWCRYFGRMAIRHIFYSAHAEQDNLDRISKSEIEEEDIIDRNMLRFTPDARLRDEEDYLSHIHTRAELLEEIKALANKVTEGKPGTVGMVGYPNVGKSSTINTLFKSRKVAVAATPGKTKHFQTLILENGMTLCDCPGLVFPTFTTSKADLVCNGILPIDQLRDYRAPCNLVAQRIPRQVLEQTYGIVLPPPHLDENPNRPPTGTELLCAHAKLRGFMTVHGMPDESRSARFVLKDYVNGKLLYCNPPPNATIAPAVSSESTPTAATSQQDSAPRAAQPG